MSSQNCSGCDKEFLIMQFDSLRNEILGIKERLVREFAIGLTGIPVLIGLADKFNIYLLLLITPIIVVSGGLMLMYEQNSIMRAGSFIRSTIEGKLLDHKELGWEYFLENAPSTRFAENVFKVSVVLAYSVYYIAGTLIAYNAALMQYGQSAGSLIAFIYSSAFPFFVYYLIKNFSIHNNLNKAEN